MSLPQDVNPNCNLAVVIELGSIILSSLVCNCPDVPVTRVAVEAFPVKAPVKVVAATDVNPARVEPVAPKAILVVPTIKEGLAKFAFVIPAVPDKFEFVRPETVPDRVRVPVDVIGPPPRVIPLTVPEADTDVTPLFVTFVAQEAVADCVA